MRPDVRAYRKQLLEGVSMAEDLSGLDTFPKLLLHHAKVRGDLPAIREKDLGI